MTLLHSVETQETLGKWADNELTMPQFIALHILDAAGPSSVSGLQMKLRLSASATSHLVDRLVGRGFVDRAEDPADRRQKIVRITPSGIDLVRELTAARNDQICAGLAGLSLDTQARLAEVIHAAITEIRTNGARQCPGS